MKSELIIALDLPNLKEARHFIRQFHGENKFFKIGLRLFVAEGPDVVQMVHDEGGEVFLDLKFHDIPNTVAQACEAALALKPFMINLHASGGIDMMHAAFEMIKGVHPRPLLVGVTVLTSEDEPDTHSKVLELAELSQRAGLDGVVCSAHEIQAIKKQFGSQFVIVTPGIRISPHPKDDQRRTATPSEAAQWGAHYMVMGRPLLTSPHPLQLLREIKAQIALK